MLRLIGGEQLDHPLVPLPQKIRIVAFIEVDGPIADFEDTPHGGVEEVSVVRDHDEGRWIALQIRLEPVARFEVEVVGGLIEQKEAGLLQEQFGQGYPHLPSPTELLAGPVPVASRKTQAVKHCPHSRIDCVASMQPELLRHRGVPLELFVMFGAGVFHFGQFMLEPAALFL